MKRLLPLFLASLVLFGSGLPHARGDALEAELFEPEFLYAQREALGLSEAQLAGMEKAMEEARTEFEKRKGELTERAKALQEVIHKANPDMKTAEDRLRALLSQETEVKAMHMLTMLKVRNQLTPEQLEKARTLRTTANAAAGGQRDRIQAKLAKLRDAVKGRLDAGNLPPEVMERAPSIQEMLQGGKEDEAERLIDALLAKLAEKPKS